jgi:hypothetical protein
MPATSATALGGEGFALASGYDEVQGAIQEGIPAASRARPDEEPEDGSAADALSASEAVDEAAAADADGDDAGYPPAPAAAVREPLEVVGAPASSRTAEGGGYAYVAEGEGLKVYQGAAAGDAVQSLNLYDYTNAGGQAVAVALAGGTLAVLYATDEGVFYPSTDYALSAYAAPRTLLIFFDASDPAELSFVSAVGLSGTPRALHIAGPELYVATSHPVAPDVGADGQWELAGREPSEVAGYAASLTLRAAEPVAYVPGYFDDGLLTPFSASQLYLSGYGPHTAWTAVGAFSLAERRCTSLFALLDPGVPLYSASSVGESGFALAYEVDYEDALVRTTLTAPVAADATMPGIGSVEWSAP